MELTISLPYGEERLGMIGSAERNLKILREGLGVSIFARDGCLRISGESKSVGRTAHVLEQLHAAARRRHPFNRQELLAAIASASRHEPNAPHSPDHPEREGLEVYSRAHRIQAMTEGQKVYLQAIFQHDLSFCIGPAGTGKTYLAVAAAVSMLKRGQIRKLVLVRPAVEAGERLGYLPGDLQQKVHPFLRPLLDALHDMMDFDQVQRFMSSDVIEIIPLAFMRGRTLNDSLIILDEAQNTTRQQMLMFLTRLGHGSKMIITGDTTQIDLADPTQSGLIDAVRRLRRIKGAAFVTLSQRDIVRHSLVQQIVEAYAPPQRARSGKAAPAPACDSIPTPTSAPTAEETPPPTAT